MESLIIVILNKKETNNKKIVNKSPNNVGYFLQKKNILQRNDKNKNGKIQNFVKSTKKLVQPVKQELETYPLLEIVLCMLKKVVIITVKVLSLF